MESANRFGTAFGVPNSTLSNEAEKEYLFYLAREFGAAWRVTPLNTLFDYRPGQNTEYFTDYSFPRYHRTVRDLSQTQRDAARRDCENDGIRGNELDGCIFDRGHIGLPPTRQPEVIDRTAGVVLPVIQGGGRVVNVNPRQPETGSAPTKPVVIGGVTKQPAVEPVKPVVIGSEPKAPPTEKPTPVIQSKPVGSGENVGSTKPTETKSPVSPVVVEPIVSPKPIENQPVERPKPVYESKPIENKPVEKPKQVNESQPVVKPAPAPKPSTPAPKLMENKPVVQPSTPVKVATPAPTPAPKPMIAKPR
jgi:hypothetical protein